MPVLDCQMWVGPCAREIGVPKELMDHPPTTHGPLKQVIHYEFYRKPMSRQTPLLERSALPDRVKVSTVSQETIRRLKNTSRELEVVHMNNIIEQYICDLKRGGFSQEWILNAVGSGVTGYIRMVQNEISGLSPLNRPEKFTKTNRRYKSLCLKSDWFKKSTQNNQSSAQNSENPAQNFEDSKRWQNLPYITSKRKFLQNHDEQKS